jgi:peptidoglycan hydrolase-like protein with peptidoglycan-binding domain
LRILATIAALVVLLSATPLMAQSAPKPATTTKRTVSKKHRKRRPRGQQKMDAARIRDIQEALIREKYLAGPATGKWDAATESALRRLQGAQGWQTKVVPDSRALIKLGLGPDHDHLLNPESAMTSLPATHPAAEPAEAKKP